MVLTNILAHNMYVHIFCCIGWHCTDLFVDRLKDFKLDCKTRSGSSKRAQHRGDRRRKKVSTKLPGTQCNGTSNFPLIPPGASYQRHNRVLFTERSKTLRNAVAADVPNIRYA